MRLVSRVLQIGGTVALVVGVEIVFGVGAAFLAAGVLAVGFGALLEREVG